MSGEGVRKQLRHPQACLPPVPDLIPLEDLARDAIEGEASVLENIEKSKRRIRVMEAQRAERASLQAAGAEEIDSTSLRLTQASPFKTGSKRNRKLTHRRRTEIGERPNSVSMVPEAPTNPRVNPIFLWVRQEDTKIVDVKCEDYDKRNRILLTKTAHGWRAIPRMESLSKNCGNSESCAEQMKKKKRHRKKKTKCKAVGVQVEERCFIVEEPVDGVCFNGQSEVESTCLKMDEDKKRFEEEIHWDEEINIESHIPTHTIHITRPLQSTLEVESPEMVTNAEQFDSASMSSPLDKLLAVAELELKSVEEDIPSPSGNSFIDCVKELEDKNESYLDNLVLDSTQTSLQMTGINYNELQGDYCDYNEDDDNNSVMDDILNRLEQSLGNPDVSSLEETNNNDKLFDHENICEKTTDIKSNFEDEITDLTPIVDLTKQLEGEQQVAEQEIVEPEEILPTDLSFAKRVSQTPPVDVKAQRTFDPETIQSPEPSGIPAVTPDIMTSSSPNFSCSEVTHDEPLNLEKPRKSESPLVSCSEEIHTSSCNLENEIMEMNECAKQDSNQNIKILDKSPYEQLEYILKYTKLRIPDPILVPKDRLNVILTTPATEIPRLLFDRPELKLPAAMIFPHLMEDPELLVLTITQLQSIMFKHFKSTGGEDMPFTEADVSSTAKITTTQRYIESPSPIQQQVVAEPPSIAPQKPKPKPPKQSNDSKPKQHNEIPANLKTPTFNQFMWMPYLYQLEAAAMAYDNKINEFMKSCSNPYNVYPNTYQYQNLMPQQTVPFSYQQELMKLSSLQAPPVDMFSPKKMKYSGLLPEHAPMKPAKQYNEKQIYHNNKFNANFNLGNCPPAQWANQAANLHQSPADHFSSYKHKPSRHYRSRVNKNVNNKTNEAKVRADAMRAFSSKAAAPEQIPRVDLRPFGIVQPIDLSNSRTGRGGYRGEQINMTRLALLRNDDVAEVGSTTSGLEEPHMQHLHCDPMHSQAGLWHPLFGK